MAFKCNSHGWRHLLKPCPDCPPISTDSLEVQELKKKLTTLETKIEELDKENNRLLYLMAELTNEDKKIIDGLERELMSWVNGNR